ncbi:hypothetical protein [Pseudomonas fragariae (ex Marin et al. 2024)]|uniref:hypothetical protein n=1 Tax=Pseudomonas fragariae (ex Marin et al. 2024) TaxID=3080056 RepID=UPI003F7A0A8F
MAIASVAPKGKVELQAQSDAMELKAQQGAKITSAGIGIGIGIGKQDEGGEGAVPTLRASAHCSLKVFCKP